MRVFQSQAFVRVLVALALGIAIAGGLWLTKKADQTARRPNVLIIVADDQRFDAAIPSMRELFSDDQSTIYTNAYASSALCCPSRSAILSGRFDHNTGVHDNGYKNQCSTDFDHSTGMAAQLLDQGYHTGVIGKLMNDSQKPGQPTPYFLDSRIGYGPNGYQVQEHITENLEAIINDISVTGSSDHQPWMVWYGARAPHTPLRVEPKYRDADVGRVRLSPGQLERDISDKPAYLKRHIQHHHMVDQFDMRSRSEQRAAELKTRRYLLSLDEAVRDVFEYLREQGELDDTMIILTSDHGYMLGEHGGLARKVVPYEEAVHVPLAIHWPASAIQSGAIPSEILGERDDRLASLVDLAPTIYDVLDVAPSNYDPDGISLLSERERAWVPTEHTVSSTVPLNNAVISRDWHLIESLKPNGSALARELYDLRRDPYELNNLLGRSGRKPLSPETLAAYVNGMEQIRRWRDCVGENCQ